MIRAPLFLLIAAATAQAVAAQGYDPGQDSRRYDGCVRAIPTDAAKAEAFAIEWQALGGGLPARHCQALAQMHRGEHAAAAATLAKAAQAAEVQKSPMAADFWGQAGNAAMLAGDARGAVGHFTTALLAVGEFAPVRRANLLIDRARAQVDLGALPAARTDLDQALALAPAEPTAWLLSAALARRAQDLPRASTDITRAAALAPADPDVQFEQGAIAAASGDLEAARKLWAQLVKTAPASPAGSLAAKALAALPAA